MLWPLIPKHVPASGGFIFNIASANQLVQQIADLGRVPDARMHDWIQRGSHGAADYLFLFGQVATYAQVAMAFWAIQRDLVVLASFFVCMVASWGIQMTFDRSKRAFKLYDYQVEEAAED